MITLVNESSRLTIKYQNYEEAKTRTYKIQRIAWQMEIPGLPNNTTGILMQKKIVSRALVDHATDEKAQAQTS